MRSKKESSKTRKSVNSAALTIADSLISVFTQVSPLDIGNAFKSVYQTYREEIFYEKMQSFFQESESISSSEKQAFLDALMEDKQSFFKRLFILLDRLDEREKANIIGRLFKALIKQIIDSDSFLRLCTAIDQVYMNDLEFLKNRYSSTGNRKYKMMEAIISEKGLANAGLVHEHYVTSNSEENGMRTLPTAPRYLISPIGKMLLEIGYDLEYKQPN
jgi:hypothetical protein